MTILPINASDFLFLDNTPEQEIVVKKATIADFTRLVKNNPDKNFELLNGRIVAMASASPEHNRIINNIGYHLTHFFRTQQTPCLFYSETSLEIDDYTCVQPDLMVICHRNKPIKGKLSNPIIVGEVYSSNRKNDREKLLKYQHLPSVQEIMLLEQNKMELTLYRQDSHGNWNSVIYRTNDSVYLQSIDLSIDMAAIYEYVDL